MSRNRLFISALAAFLALAAPAAAAALDFGLSAASQSFGSKDYAEAGLRPGLHARGGAILGLFSRLELEPYAVMELTPEPLRGCLFGADVNLALLGSRYDGYFNMFLSAGYARGADFSDPGAGKNYLSLRITPLAIGCGYYGRRDRMFTAGVLYELEGKSWTFVFNVLAFDFLM